MELGQLLKDARLEAGLSQRALCDGIVTRNMLSQIESGKAKPSMDTLRAFAARLGKPVAFFLAEEGAVCPDQPVILRARDAYSRQEYRQALEILKEYRGGLLDPEWELLTRLCCLELGRQALEQGKTVYARELLTRADNPTALYQLPGLERERLLLLAQAGEPVELPADDRELLFRAERAMAEGLYGKCQTLLQAVRLQDDRWAFLMGSVLTEQGEYARGAELLRRAEGAFPKETAPLLERCYRELGDYKSAYEYACKQR